MFHLPEGVVEKFLKTGRRMVYGEGNPKKKWWIVGEAPGEDEERVGRPFVGKSGHFLDGVLKIIGLRREDFYITNICPIRPPGNDFTKISDYGLEMSDCERWIWALLDIGKPSRVIALGNYALNAITGMDGITQWRGSVLDGKVTWPLKIIPTFHPAHILRLGETGLSMEDEISPTESDIGLTYGGARITMVWDIQKATRPVLENKVRNYILNPNWAVGKEFIEKAKKAEYYTVDVEAKGKFIDCLALAISPEEACCFVREGNSWDREIEELFHVNQKVVMQNASYDLWMLEQNGIRCPKVWLDTMSAHHWLWCELPHTLAYMQSVYTTEPYHKWMLEDNDDEEAGLKRDERRWIYNCTDAAVTHEVAAALLTEMNELGIQEKFFSFVMPLFHLFKEVGEWGVLVDLEVMKKLRDEMIAERDRIKAELGEGINWNSPVQLKNYLYNQLKLPPQYNRKTKRLTTDEKALQKLYKEHPNHPVLVKILELREKEKMIGTYLNTKSVVDGRLRTLYNISGTDTGRLSSKQRYDGTGWNSQNAPPWFRKAIIPDEGEVFVEADLSQAEIRIVAALAGETKMLEVFKNGGDIHKENASRIFKVPIDKVSDSQRYQAKRIGHALDYGLGVHHAAEIVNVSVAEARKFMEGYFSVYPNIKKWQDDVKRRLSENRVIVTPLGRRRVFLGRLGDALYRKALAFVPQSTCVDYLNSGLVRLAEKIKLFPVCKILLQIHDAVLVSCKPECVDVTMKLMKECIEVPLVIGEHIITIPLEFKVGIKNWGEMVKV